ncbi:MAG: endopeptidase La [Bacteriovoracales bacterium]|nr:endopeptidase La [Bacteriovoracales bacterium]
MAENNNENDNIEFKDTLPLLPVRDIVIYPFMIIPLFIGRESSIRVVEEACNNYDRLIFLPAQKDILEESPSPEGIFEMGTVSVIMRKRYLKDGRVKILIQGLTKARITDFIKTKPFYKVGLEKIDPQNVAADQISCEAMVRNVKENLEKVISIGKVLTQDILMILEDTSDPGRLADLIAANLNLKVNEAQMILETINPEERLHQINEILLRELAILSTQERIKTQAHEEISKSQKEYFLREQIRAIKNELGDKNINEFDEFQEFRQKIKECKMPEEAEKEALEQLSRLEKMHPDSSEASILRTYLDWLVVLPWKISSQETLDLKAAKSILDEDHFELEKVKERILEFLAVRKLKKGKIRGPILCFSGPPGVGKTSLGKSIAKSTNREFVRLSLGGIKDEAEIRGHRRTYVGAMPGRFIQALKQAGTNNPVIMLDEIDKLGADFRGDPSSALLEVLDAEQNFSFRDHYLNVPFDLSKIMFIATANIMENIPAPLRDRMEVLSLSGYTQEEKIAIAKKYLIPKQVKDNGISEDHVEFLADAVETIIKNYTSEAGLRNLERQLGSLCRKVAKKVALGDTEKTAIDSKVVIELLGPPNFIKDEENDYDEVGVSTGLAWTSVGGEILHIESTTMAGKGLTLTGQLGEVMKESAQACIGYIRSQSERYDICHDFFDKNEIHLHMPAGAIPKDGPSAGIAMATAIISSLSGLPVDKNVAMTGEITLTGKVLPIGGIKEKSLAAMRVGIKTIIIPYQNKKDLDEIPEEYRKRIDFIPVKFFDEVLEKAIVGWKTRIKNIQKKSEQKIRQKNRTTSMAA